jgi:hypothetical protein
MRILFQVTLKPIPVSVGKGIKIKIKIRIRNHLKLLGTLVIHWGKALRQGLGLGLR